MHHILRTLTILVTATMLLAILTVPSRAAGCAAGPFVTAAGQAILRAVRTRSPTTLAGVASRYSDIHGLAMFSLGPYRKALPDARKAEYVALTRAYVGRFLARYGNRVSGTSLTVISCSGNANAPVVTARLNGGGKAVFRLYKTRRGYLMRDVNIASIWLGAQMRSTFTSIIQKSGGNLSGLFAYLRG